MINTSIWERLMKNEVFFIAEIGKNFIQSREGKSVEEYLDNAKKLINQAKAAGADAVKFQTHRVEDEQMPIKVMSPHFKGEDRYSWVKRNTDITPDRFWKELEKYCQQEDIIFFSTPMSRGAARVLNNIGVKLWKIGSGDILDFVMLDYIRKTDKPIIISSGMSTLAELDKSLQFILEKSQRVVLMHCVSKYPCPLNELNVRIVKMFKEKYHIPIGFSDHSMGSKGVMQAVKCGASIIEKHFSSSREHWGSDHKVSMTPAEYTDMVKTIRQGICIEDNKEILGLKEINELPDHESEFRNYFRKTLVAGRDIKKGEAIEMDMLYAMRPQASLRGLKSEEATTIVGIKAKRDIDRYQVITQETLRSKQDNKGKIRLKEKA